MPSLPGPEPLPSIDGYRVSRLIAEGRVARIYLAGDHRRGGQVALKVLKASCADSAAIRKRFAAECAVLSSIRHEHVVRAIEHSAGGDPGYVAMEYLQGGTLRDRMRAGLGEEQAVSLLRQAAGALAAAHRRAIVHRDVKPENFLMRACDVLVLTDFGVAAGPGNTAWSAAPGGLVGTPSYASPEQAQGEPSTAAADVYSLGVMFYEMLCGRRPFAGRTALEILSQHLVAQVPALPGELARYQPLIDLMLEKRPKFRLPDGDAVLREIRRALPAVMAMTS
jgi:serine/threonine-protein kinase PpkA